MCELLAMSANTPTDLCFSFTGKFMNTYPTIDCPACHNNRSASSVDFMLKISCKWRFCRFFKTCRPSQVPAKTNAIMPRINSSH